MIQEIKLSKIQLNNGQIEGVPKNPRFVKDEKFDKLKKSIIDDPEMLALRELIVVPHEGKFICIAGNMRLRALRELKHETATCKVIDFDAQKLRAIATKDNLPYGEWDWEVLANDWDIEELEEWGVESPFDENENLTDEYGEDFSLPDGNKAPFQQMTFTLADEQAEQIKNAIADIKQTDEYKYCETMGNENSNGNALYLIVMQWAEQRKKL